MIVHMAVFVLAPVVDVSVGSTKHQIENTHG